MLPWGLWRKKKKKKDKPVPKVDDVRSPSVEDKIELRVDVQFIRQPGPARQP